MTQEPRREVEVQGSYVLIATLADEASRTPMTVLPTRLTVGRPTTTDGQ